MISGRGKWKYEGRNWDKMRNLKHHREEEETKLNHRSEKNGILNVEII